MSHLPPDPRARDDGIRRLSRLTWRAAQMSAIGVVAFATLFARTAAANTATATKTNANAKTAKAPLKPAAHVSQHPAKTTGLKLVTKCPGPRRQRRHHAAAAAATPAAPSAPAAPAPAQTVAPPPAPPAPAPAPPQTTSSGSHGGG